MNEILRILFTFFFFKFSYPTQEFSLSLNWQFHGYTLEFFFLRKRYFEKCKKILKFSNLFRQSKEFIYCETEKKHSYLILN